MSNTQENDKFLTKERKIYLGAWVIIAIYLAIALPIHFCVSAFSWHWFCFGLFFLIIPLGLICSKTYFENKMNQTAEQQKKFNQALGIGMLKFWLADFVYMTAFNHWLIPTYIIGIIVLIIVFNSLVNAFLGKRDNNSFLNFCLASDLIIGIALTIYLIYIIPENTGNLQNIITTIVAAIYGGLLTLVGVAWTIRRQDDLHRRDEKSKNKPMFRYCIVHNDIEDYVMVFCFEGIDDRKSGDFFHFDYVFKNFDNANFILEYIIVNDIKMYPQFDANIEKNEYFIIRGLCKKGEIVTKYLIGVKDILGNDYTFELLFDCDEPTMVMETKEK